MSSEQRARIIRAALEMYIEHGVKSVRMDDIAQKMRISKRTIYEIFGDKEELLYAAVQTHMEELSAKLDRVGGDATNILVSILKVQEYLVTSTDSTSRLRSSVRQFYPSIYERLRMHGKAERESIFKQRLMTGVEQGLIKGDIDMELLVSIMFYLCTAIVENDNKLTIPEGMAPHEAFRTSIVIVLRGVSTAKGIDVIDNYLAH